MRTTELADCTATVVMPFGWYAAYTRHQHEKSVSQVLEQKGFEVLLPSCLTLHHNLWSAPFRESGAAILDCENLCRMRSYRCQIS